MEEATFFGHVVPESACKYPDKSRHLGGGHEVEQCRPTEDGH